MVEMIGVIQVDPVLTPFDSGIPVALFFVWLFTTRARVDVCLLSLRTLL